MKTALVVDDSMMDQHIAGTLLENQARFEVRFAPDGRAALLAMEKNLPNIVVTDLLMPGMDGLELVEAIRKRHPEVPVILMTAHGSEKVATDALRAGAASYVPKKVLAEELAKTAQNVLDISDQDRVREQMLRGMEEASYRFVLDSNPEHIRPLVGFFHEQLDSVSFGDEAGLMQMKVALDEALTNAIHHGNLEVSSEIRERSHSEYMRTIEERRKTAPWSERRIHITARLSPDQAAFTIRDEGPGFDVSSLPDPTDPLDVDKVHGRGIFLIRTFMDEVNHNEAGNEITMIKRRN